MAEADLNVTGDDAPKRDASGKWLPGNRGGPGRSRQRPLRDVVTFEREAELWEMHYELAKTETGPREFILRNVAGNPYQSAPPLPPIAWPSLARVEDLLGAFNAILGAQKSGDLDSAGLAFLTDLLMKFSKVLETVEMAPRLARLEEHWAAQQAMQGAGG